MPRTSLEGKLQSSNMMCTCHDFVSMLTNLKKIRKFVPCKHLYFIFKISMLYNHKIHDFINWLTLNINEIKKLFAKDIQLG